MGNDNSAPFSFNFEDFAEPHFAGNIPDPDEPSSIRKRLCTNLLANRRQTADVEFIGTERIPAHKAILVETSDVFHARFYGPFGSVSEIDLTEESDITAESFKDFHGYVYVGEIDLSLDTAVSVLYLSKKYPLEDLTKECIAYVDRTIQTANVFSLLEHIGKHEEVDTIFWDVVDTKTKAVISATGFLNLCLEDVVEIIGRDSLSAREIDVYHAVIAWASAALTRHDDEVNRENVRELLGVAFYLVRFKQMHPEEFEEGPAKSGYLSEEEKKLFSLCPADILERFDSTPRTGAVPEFVPKRRVHEGRETRFVQRSLCVTKHGVDVHFDPNKTVYLGNLPYGMSDDSFDAFIEEHIDPTGTDVLNYKLFPARGFAFIVFASPELAANAVVDLDGLRYRRRLLQCDFHKDRRSEDEDGEDDDWGNLNPYQPGRGLYGAW
ncbi:BTB/POZ domain-containing protein 3-like protein [Aphelenchoides avenae]|nr:BTB/POZ domain-containing protein 3-like protein [Aphelenchus avenae]